MSSESECRQSGRVSIGALNGLQHSLRRRVLSEPTAIPKTFRHPPRSALTKNKCDDAPNQKCRRPSSATSRVRNANRSAAVRRRVSYRQPGSGADQRAGMESGSGESAAVVAELPGKGPKWRLRDIGDAWRLLEDIPLRTAVISF